MVSREMWWFRECEVRRTSMVRGHHIAKIIESVVKGGERD